MYRPTRSRGVDRSRCGLHCNDGPRYGPPMLESMRQLSESEPNWAMLVLGLFGSLLILASVVCIVLVLIHVGRHPVGWKRAVQRVASRTWTWRDAAFVCLAMLMMHLVLFLVVNGLAGLLPQHIDVLTSASIVVQTLLFQGGGIALVHFLIRAHHTTWRDAFGIDTRHARRDVLRGIVLYFAAVPVVGVTAWAYRALLTACGVEVEPQAVIRIFLAPEYPTWLKVYLAGLAVAVAPFVEEFLFRGIGLPVLLKHARPAWSIVGLSVAFAAIHFSLPALVPLFVIAAAFSLAYAATGSLVVPIAMHMTFNAVSLLVLLVLQLVPGGAELAGF